MKHHRTVVRLRGLGAGVLLPLLGLGCATAQPRVVEVNSTTRLEKIGRVDRDFLYASGAGRLSVQSGALPKAQQRQEFFVRWSAAGLAQVRFEYRQVNRPATVLEQTHTPQRRAWTVFAVRGQDYHDGGAVSAWRVSLWDEEGRLLAEKHSALW
jgi:hypothetical protein